jgi:uncharacterized protein (TIGR00369 family)
VIEREGYKYLPNWQDNRCFGCGPANPSGLKMQFYTDEKSIACWISVSDLFTGWNNLVHGGILSTLLDEIMGRAAIYLLKKLPMTKSMKIDFIKPVYAGMEIKVVGKVIKHDEREALIEGTIYNDKGEVCTICSGTLGLFSIEFMKKRGVIREQFEEWLKNL